MSILPRSSPPLSTTSIFLQSHGFLSLSVLLRWNVDDRGILKFLFYRTLQFLRVLYFIASASFTDQRLKTFSKREARKSRELRQRSRVIDFTELFTTNQLNVCSTALLVTPPYTNSQCFTSHFDSFYIVYKNRTYRVETLFIAL